jgi:hypothetical protein
MADSFRKIASFKGVEDFKDYLKSIGVELPCDDTLETPASTLAKPVEVDGHKIGNRLCVLPMEGGTASSTAALAN